MSGQNDLSRGPTPPPAPKGGLRRYGGRGGEERQAERRERLLDAGLACYGDVGYHAATVRMICARAGLTERYFYESFANGEDLLCAVYLRHLELQRARIAGAMLEAAGAGEAAGAVSRREANASIHDPTANANATANVTNNANVNVTNNANANVTNNSNAEAMLEAGLRAFLVLARENPAGARLQFVEVLGVSPRVDKLYRQAVEDFALLLRNWNSELTREDPVYRGDPATLAVGLVGAAVGIGSRWLLSGYAQSLEVMLATLLTLFRGVWEQTRPSAPL